MVSLLAKKSVDDLMLGVGLSCRIFMASIGVGLGVGPDIMERIMSSTNRLVYRNPLE